MATHGGSYQADQRRRRLERLSAQRQQLTASLVGLRNQLEGVSPVAVEARTHAHELRIVTAAIEALTQRPQRRRERWEIEADQTLIALAQEELAERLTLEQALDLAK